MNLLKLLSTSLESLLDAIIPLRARSARVREQTAENIPLSPTVHNLFNEEVTTLMDYRKREVQDLIRSLKYDGSVHAAKIAAQIVAEYLLEEIASRKFFSTQNILIVPIPLHAARKRERGFNQIEIVLRQLPEEFKDGSTALLALNTLMRIRATNHQTRLSRSERIKNVIGAFRVADESILKDTHIFLIDDVATTGATLVNAAKPLRDAEAEVSLLALARA